MTHREGESAGDSVNDTRAGSRRYTKNPPFDPLRGGENPSTLLRTGRLRAACRQILLSEIDIITGRGGPGRVEYVWLFDIGGRERKAERVATQEGGDLRSKPVRGQEAAAQLGRRDGRYYTGDGAVGHRALPEELLAGGFFIEKSVFYQTNPPKKFGCDSVSGCWTKSELGSFCKKRGKKRGINAGKQPRKGTFCGQTNQNCDLGWPQNTTE
jgi:hypothetical protein